MQRRVDGRPAVVLTLEDAVTPATADYLIRGIVEAEARGAGLVVIRIDTPGGLVTSTREIISAILDSNVPVAAWVAPSGARAASAGTYLDYASNVAVMAPSTRSSATFGLVITDRSCVRQSGSSGTTPKSAGFGTAGGDDTELGRHDVQPFGHIFADAMKASSQQRRAVT